MADDRQIIQTVMQKIASGQVDEDVGLKFLEQRGIELPREFLNAAYNDGILKPTFAGEAEAVAGQTGEGVAGMVGFAGDALNRGVTAAFTNFPKPAKDFLKNLPHHRYIKEKTGLGFMDEDEGALDFPLAQASEKAFKDATNLKQPQTTKGRVVGRIGKELPGAIIPGGGSAKVRTLASMLSSAAGGLTKEATGSEAFATLASLLAPLGGGGLKVAQKSLWPVGSDVKNMAQTTLHKQFDNPELARAKLANVIHGPDWEDQMVHRSTAAELTEDPRAAAYQMTALKNPALGREGTIKEQATKFIASRQEARGDVANTLAEGSTARRSGVRLRDRLTKRREQIKDDIQAENFEPAFRGDPEVGVTGLKIDADKIEKKHRDFQVDKAPPGSKKKDVAVASSDMVGAADQYFSKIQKVAPYSKKARAEWLQNTASEIKAASRNFKTGNRPNLKASQALDELTESINQVAKKVVKGEVSGDMTPEQAKQWAKGVERWKTAVIEVYDEGLVGDILAETNGRFKKYDSDVFDMFMPAAMNKINPDKMDEVIKAISKDGDLGTGEIKQVMRAEFARRILSAEAGVPRTAGTAPGIAANKKLSAKLKKFKPSVVGEGKLFSEEHYKRLERLAENMQREARMAEIENISSPAGPNTAPIMIKYIDQLIRGGISGGFQFRHPAKARALRMGTAGLTDRTSSLVNQAVFEAMFKDPRIAYEMLKAPTPEGLTKVATLMAGRGGLSAQFHHRAGTDKEE